MSKKEEQFDVQFQQMIEAGVNKWRRRKDFKIKLFNKEFEFKNNGKIPVQVQDVIDAHWKNDKLKPLIMDWQFDKEKQKYTFKIHLPGGISYNEFESKHVYFKDATHSTVKIEYGRGDAIVILTVIKVKLPELIPYKWDWLKKTKGMYIPIPIGIDITTGEVITVELTELPHILLAGLSRHGKSNQLHVLAVSALYLPNVYVCAIDLSKRGAEFGYLKKAGCIVTKDMETTTELLSNLFNTMEDRYDIFEKLGIVKIQEYQGKDMPYIVLVCDEIAGIQDKICHSYLIDIIQRGAGAGIHIIGATQRPSHTAFKGSSFTDFRSQFGATCCYHVSKRNDSQVVLGNDKGILIPKIPGRCLYDSGDDEKHVQSLFLPVTDFTRNKAVKSANKKIKDPEKKFKIEDVPTANELVDRLAGNGVIVDDDTFVWKQPQWDGLQGSQQLTVVKQKYNL